MRAARACIGSRGAAAEIIADGDTGLLVEPGDRGAAAAGRRCGCCAIAPATVAMGAARPRAVSAAVHRGAVPRPFHRAAAGGVVNILGLNAYHGDVSAALVRDGQLDRGGRRRALPPHQARRRLSAGRRCAPASRWAGSRRPTSTCSPSRAIRARICCARRGSCCATGRRAPSPRARATWSACGRCPATIAEALGLDEARVPSADAVRRASSGASGERRLRLAVRRGGDLRDRRLRRLRQHVVGPRRRTAHDGRRPRLLSALARPALSRDHAVPRLSRTTATSSR